MSGQGGRNAITAGSKIFKKVAAGNAKAKTGSVRIGVATEAEGWKRPLETAPESIGGRLKEYIEAWDQGPKPGTVEMVARDAEHASADPQRHMTVECFDKDGNKIETVHVPAPEPTGGKK
ncbi:hypothetical protein INS49_003381 [Diaporthe citri]|uniref:uncharacterized protein n=1 Tax=Diaporthe citri TaxID=83186 RepID=UPI001C810BD3|nr:uncharacterized protein INS49_003381 [Diaporthe citri]KAG6355419.1 hypothetical protein INS49_003381 [Diaporthe citri]